MPTWVSAGSIHPVNEKGRPELLSVGNRDYLLMGSQGGNVKAAGGSQQTVNVAINQQFAAGTDRRTINQAAAAAGAAVQRALARQT